MKQLISTNKTALIKFVISAIIILFIDCKAQAAPAFKQITGPGTSLHFDVNGGGATTSYFAINDRGGVALFPLGSNTIVISDGEDVISSSGFSGLFPYSVSINNQNELLIGTWGPEEGSYKGALKVTAPPYSTAQQIPLSFNDQPYYASSFNDNGEGVVIQNPDLPYQSVSKFEKDGSLTSLFTDSNVFDLATGAHGDKPRITALGDIYFLGHDTSGAGSNRIIRIPASGGAAETVASKPRLNMDISFFDVNNLGDLIYVVIDATTGQQWIEVLKKKTNTTHVVVDTSIASSSEFWERVCINNVGQIAMLKHHKTPYTSAVYYGENHGESAITRLIGSGDTLDNSVVRYVLDGMDLNNSNQIVLNINFSTNDNRIYRIDGEGSTPGNPNPPDPPLCEEWGRPDFCFEGRCGVRCYCTDKLCPQIACYSNTCYFDPEYAHGYIYSAKENSFDSVTIPYDYGDGQFDLYLYDQVSKRFVDSGHDVVSGETFNFTEELGANNGLTDFALYGIEVEAQVDPADPYGFVTGLSFASPGEKYQFSMTPVVDSQPPDNQPPVANAGSDQTVILGTLVELNGSGSIDPDNGPQPLTFSWIQTPESTVILQDATTESPEFKADSIGSSTFKLTVSGGEATSNDEVNIKTVYDFKGFFSPVDNLPVFNEMNAGRSVPVKFSLQGNQGLAIFASTPSSKPVACDIYAVTDAIEVTVNDTSSKLTYDVLSDTYNYVWNTDKAWTGTCRQLDIALIDGTSRSAQFKFKK